MLKHLIDRLGSTTILSLLVVCILWKTTNASHAVISYGMLFGFGFYYITVVVNHFSKELKIRKLGGHAPCARTWTPFNIGLIITAVRSFNQHRYHEWWAGIFRRFANQERPHTTEALTAGQRVVFTADDENIKAILATQFQDYGKGPRFREEWKEFLGLSIFTTDHDLWHDSRMLLRPQFMKNRVSDLQTFEHHLQTLLPLLGGSHDGATVRFDDLAYRYTLDAATEFLLGRSVDSLKNEQAEFATAFSEIQNKQGAIARAGPLAPLLIPRKAFRAALEVLNRFVNQYIDEALALPATELERKTKSDEGYTFLHAIAAYTRDRTILRDQLVAVLLAGRDTTAMTLSWLFYELSQHPQVVEKLRAEIMQHVGLHRQPTYDDLKSMRYMQHTLNETLRLYPVVPFNVRVALQDTTLPHGGGPDGKQPFGVLKDDVVAYSTLLMQRRADIYPPTAAGFADPLAFVPERWDHWTPRPWTYIPFNGGPRICIGQQFALTEMAYTVVRILQTFARVECRSERFPGLRTDIVLQPADGVYLALFRDEKG